MWNVPNKKVLILWITVHYKVNVIDSCSIDSNKADFPVWNDNIEKDEYRMHGKEADKW